MDALDCIKGRRSVRKYTDEKISHETIAQIVEAATFAPSWKNTQTIRYHVVEDRALLDNIAENAIKDFPFNTKTIHRCAALAVVTGVKGICGYEEDGSFSTSKGDRWEMFDAGVAAETFCLSTYAQGVGTVILGIFEDDAVGKIIGIPENEQVMALIAMGYPEKTSTAPERKRVEEVLTIH